MSEDKEGPRFSLLIAQEILSKHLLTTDFLEYQDIIDILFKAGIPGGLNKVDVRILFKFFKIIANKSKIKLGKSGKKTVEGFFSVHENLNLTTMDWNKLIPLNKLVNPSGPPNIRIDPHRTSDDSFVKK